MKSQSRVLFAVAGFVVEFGALVALLTVPLGAWTGFVVALAAAAVTNVTYLGLIRPRLARWGATDDEAGRAMPGDGIAGPHALCSTRAVTIGMPADQVWPWLTPLSDGQAKLCAGDRILMMPGPGLEIVCVEDGHYFVACTPDAAMSWCLDAEPLDQHSCRLISRWRTQWLVTSANAPWIALSDPSSLAADRRMLLGIKARAESGGNGARMSRVGFARLSRTAAISRRG